jgi:hypothetical protein
MEDWKSIEESFASNATIPNDKTFDEIEKTISTIARFWTEQKITPFDFPLPAE